MDVIWISSYPKSGNTWLHTLLMWAAAERGYSTFDLDVYNLINKNIKPEPCLAINRELFSQNTCILKTHSTHDNLFTKINTTNLSMVGFLHIYRNPFDMLLSYINFTRIEYKKILSNIYIDSNLYKNFLFKEFLGFDHFFDPDEWELLTIDKIPTKNLDHALAFFSKNNLTLPFYQEMSSGWYANVNSWVAKANNQTSFAFKYEDLFGNFELLPKILNMFSISESYFIQRREELDVYTREHKKQSDSQSNIFYNQMKPYYFSNFYSNTAIEKFFIENERALISLGYQDILKY